MKIFIIAIVVGAFSLFSVPSQAAQQFCEDTSENFVMIGARSCPSSTKSSAVIFVIGKLKRACRLPRRTKTAQLIVTNKLLSYSKNMSGGKMVGCAASWRVCTYCKLRN